jgi:Transposase DDE domain
MSWDVVLQRFITQRPLAVLTRCIMQTILNDELDEVFEDSRSRQHTRQLLFSQRARTIADVVLGLANSPHQAYKRHRQQLRVSTTAFYNKLNRVEPSVCEAMVRHAHHKARLLQTALGITGEEPIAGYRTRLLDGNHLQKTEHRIDELRSQAAAPLPGTVVATMEFHSRLFDHVYLLEDAHAQESSVLDRVIADVNASDLLVADRHFCIVEFLRAIAGRQAAFVIRQHGRLKGQLLATRKRIGESKTGVVYEQSMVIGQTKDQAGLTVRRITVELNEPTRDGERELHLLSNVEAERASAMALAELDRWRWEIEHGFYVLTMTLTCEVASLGHPLAALFVFCLAVVAYNGSRVLTAALSAAHGNEAVEELSDYSLSCEIAQSTDGLLAVFDEAQWKSLTPQRIDEQTRFLVDVARHVDLKHHRKSRRGPKKKPPPRTGYKSGGHVATARLLASRSK